MEFDGHGVRRCDFVGRRIHRLAIERPAGNWHVYRDTLSKIARLDRVAMMVKTLCATNRPLLDRMLEFADDLNAEIVEALAPKLLVVPFSLGRNDLGVLAAPGKEVAPPFDLVRRLGPTPAQALDSRKHEIALPQGAFTFYTGHCRRGRLTVRTVFLCHPSS